MNSSDLLPLRLQNERLIGPKFSTPHEAVSYFGAIQAQDFPAAKWALGLRVENATEDVVAKAFDEGKILRTHVMRPTWHFVTPENILWMQELTASRVHAQSAYMYRKGELDDRMFGRCEEIFEEVLKDHNYLTRDELREELEKRNFNTRAHPQWMVYVLMHAELIGLICSGPRKGKQFSYALVSDRAPHAKRLSREEALAKLALIYFTSHGPAQAKDFVWWSNLSMKDTLTALDALKSQLASETIDGRTFWFKESAVRVTPPPNHSFLLSIFDEYTIAYRDRSDLSEKRDIERMIMMGNALMSVIIIDGKVAGSWKRTLGKKDVVINCNPFSQLNSKEEESLSLAAREYGKYLGLEAKINY